MKLFMKYLEKLGHYIKKLKVNYWCIKIIKYQTYLFLLFNLLLDKYCVEFITHYDKMLPVQSTTIQISMLSSLNLFVDKLALLKINISDLSIEDKTMLDLICDTFNKILKYSMGKHIVYLNIIKSIYFIKL